MFVSKNQININTDGIHKNLTCGVYSIMWMIDRRVHNKITDILIKATTKKPPWQLRQFSRTMFYTGCSSKVIMRLQDKTTLDS